MTHRDLAALVQVSLCAIQARVNSAVCSLTQSYMLIGFWPVSLNRSSVIRSQRPCLFSSVITERCLTMCSGTPARRSFSLQPASGTSR